MLLIKNLRLVKKEGKELERLKRFINAEYNNNGQKILVDLFNAVVTFYPNYKMSKTEIFQKLEPEKVYPDNVMRSLLSQLNELVEQFFIHEELRGQPILQQQILSQNYAQRSVLESSDRALKEAIELVEKEYKAQKIDILAYYNQKAELYNSSLFHPSRKDILELSPIFALASDATNKAFALRKLQHFLQQMLHQSIFKEEADYPFLTAVLAFCKNKKIEKEHIFEVYANVIALYSENVSSSLSALCNDFKKHYKTFPILIQKQLFSHIQNNNIRRINISAENAYVDAFNWLKFGIDSKLLLLDNQLGETMFLNITNVAANCHHFDWCDAFVATHKAYLYSKNPQTVLDLCDINKNLIRYEKTLHGQYLHDALRTANTILGTNVFQKLSIYSLRIKLSFHLHKSKVDELDIVRAGVLNFELYLKREKNLGEVRKASYRLYLSFFKEILNYIETKNLMFNSERRKIKESIILRINNASVINKPWLLENLINLS